MAASKVITVGSMTTYRGEYNSASTYYTANRVTYFGSEFEALANNFSNTPPLSVNAQGEVSLANQSSWKVIENNCALYNATLSTNKLLNRVAYLEGHAIENVILYFATSSSHSLTPQSWSTNRPAPDGNKYLWTKAEYKIKSGTFKTLYEVCIYDVSGIESAIQNNAMHIGDMSLLKTSQKGTLVNAINELYDTFAYSSILADELNGEII